MKFFGGGGSSSGGKLSAEKLAPRSIAEHASTTTLHIRLMEEQQSQTWTIVVNPYISFADLKATLAAQFDLQSPIRIYKGHKEIGLQDDNSIHGTLQNGDSILVRQQQKESSNQDSSPQLYTVVTDAMSVASAPARMNNQNLTGSGTRSGRKPPVWLRSGNWHSSEVRPDTKEGEQWEEISANPKEWNTPINSNVSSPSSPPSWMQQEEAELRLAMQLSAASHGDVIPKDMPSPSSQEEADVQLAMQLSAAADQSHVPPMFPALHHYDACSVPQNDAMGTMVAQGSVSQYFLDGGRSACTSICLIAAKELLNANVSLSKITPADLDQWVEQGVCRHQGNGTSHMSLEELWDFPAFSETARVLEKGLPFQGTVTQVDALYQAFRHALGFGACADRVALALTKSGETILCVNDSSHWYLFDSHGQSHEQTKLVYLKQFDCLDELIHGLQAKYPRQDFGDGSLQGDMYNMFEAIPIVVMDQKLSAAERDFDQSVEMSVHEVGDWMAPLTAVSAASNADSLPVLPVLPTAPVAPSAPMEECKTTPDSLCPPAPPLAPSPSNNDSLPVLPALTTAPVAPSAPIEECKTTRDSRRPPASPLAPSPSKTATTTAPPVSETVAAVPPPVAMDPPSYFSKSDYEDPITYLIMADPVTCDDGHTYDREVIERCFEDRVEAEQERQAAEEQRVRGEEEEEQQEAVDRCSATCCGARAPIELLSPKTNQVVSDKLVPNRTLEQQIVRLVEANALDMTEEEVEDWRQRREEKKQRDKEREEQQKREKEHVEEMKRNAEEAERNRSMDDPPEGAPHHPVVPSLRVRIDRDTRHEHERLCESDLGFSVVLSENSLRVPVDFADTSNDGPPRCMVACCARCLVGSEYRWCARCARLICDDCLNHAVTDFAENKSTEAHAICFECVSQLVDAMESGDIRIRQKRAILLRMIDRELVQFGNRAARLQKTIARQDAGEEFASRFAEVERNIARLEQQHCDLAEQVQRAHERAAEARENDGSKLEGAGTSGGTPSLEELMDQCTKLETELAMLTEQETPDDEEEQVRLLEAVSDLSHQLETARTQVAIAYSTIDGSNALTTSNADALSVDDLEQECNRLAERLEELATTVNDEEEEAELARAIELSSLSVQLEEAQMRLASASSLASRRSAPSAGLLPGVTRFLETLRERDRRPSARKGFPFGRRRPGSPSELSSLLAEMESAHASIFHSDGGHGGNMTDVTRERANEMLTLLERMEARLQTEHMPLEGLEAAREDLSEFLSNSQVLPTPDTTAQSPLLANEDLMTMYLRLSAQDVSAMSEEMQAAHAVHLSELDAILREAEAAMFASESAASPSLSSSRAPSPSSSTVEQARQDLSAIGERLQEWPLPLGLQYPTERMERQLEVLRNNLQLRLVESQRDAEAELMERLNSLQDREERIEDQVAEARRSLDSAEASAAAEERRLLERAERRRQEEAARLERERVLQERAEQARQEAEELRRRHAEAEEATRSAFSGATGSNGGAANFGGIGDFRMCRRCQAGPIENMACDNLRTHNDASTRYYGRTVASRRNPNHCPNCNWFHEDWNQWPYWDGIHGPH